MSRDIERLSKDLSELRSDFQGLQDDLWRKENARKLLQVKVIFALVYAVLIADVVYDIVRHAS